MTAPLARLMATPPRVRDDRRREQRHAVRYDAVLESARGESIPVRLADISPHGCNVRGLTDWLRPGAFIAIRLGNDIGDDEPALQAIVRWVRGDAAGMEFVRPVPAARRDWHNLMDLGIEA